MQFTQDFFKPEIREGFEIPAMMKRAWAAQMEVLPVSYTHLRAHET